MRKIILPIILLIMTLSVFANKEIRKNIKEPILIGTVVDQSTCEVLSGVKIKIDGQSVYTDLDGNFEIYNIKNGTYNVEVSLISYKENKIKNLTITCDKKNAVKIELNK